MKKPIKLLLSTALLFTGFTSLIGCGDSFDGVTINFWHTFGKTVADGIYAHAKTFSKLVKENEGVDVRVKMTYKGAYKDIIGEVSKAVAVGDNPTIAVAYPDHVANYFSLEKTKGQYVVDLTPFANHNSYGFGKETWLGDTLGQDDFVEAFIDESVSYSFEGMYSLPFMKSTEVMLYNLDLVKKAMPYHDSTIETDDGVREFMNNLTWTEFMDFCENVKGNMAAISDTLEVPCVYDSDGNLFITQMYQNEIPYSGYSDKAVNTGYIGFNGIGENASAEQIEAYNDTVAMLKKYKRWYDAGLFTTKGVTGEYSSNFLIPQQTMFAIGSSGGSGYSFPSTNEFRIEACKVPAANNNPVYVSQGPTLTLLNNVKLQKADSAIGLGNANDDAVLYGWKFMKYITNPTVNAKICTSNSEGYMPVRQSAYDTVEFTSFMASNSPYVKVANIVVNEIDGAYFNTPVFKGSAELRTQCESAFADVMKLSANPSEDAIKNILNTAINQATIKM